MTAIFVVLAVLVILGAALALTGRWSLDLSPADRPSAPEFPAIGDWDAETLGETRFRVGLRGYRMEDVDAMMASLAAQFRAEAANGDGASSGEARTEVLKAGGTGSEEPPGA